VLIPLKLTFIVDTYSVRIKALQQAVR